ncbi:hypothetical protein [Streptomyces sp. NPDC056987]|uniref:hypothetical protein n=1 Tax=Streptomyces sp. NPDC056987 TaxID=3345988 RepID=UPI0036281C0E
MITWEVNVDTTICRAHQHAAGARRHGQAQKEPPGGKRAEPGDHGLGRALFEVVRSAEAATAMLLMVLRRDFHPLFRNERDAEGR